MLSLTRVPHLCGTLKSQLYYTLSKSASAVLKKVLVSSCVEKVCMHRRALIWCSVWRGSCWEWQSSYLVFNSVSICSNWGLTSSLVPPDAELPTGSVVPIHPLHPAFLSVSTINHASQAYGPRMTKQDCLQPSSRSQQFCSIMNRHN